MPATAINPIGGAYATPGAAGVGSLDPAYGGPGTPAGYTWDTVQQKYIPTVASPANALALQNQFLSPSLTSLNSAISPTASSGSTYVPSAWSEPTSASTGMSSASTSTPTGSSGGTGVPSVAQVALPDDSAAQAAIWGRAKDQVGSQTAGSLTALRNALAGSNMLGSGKEASSTQGVITAGAGQLADTTRQQAIDEAAREADWAKTGYEGNITQRGQTISQQEADAARAQAATEAGLGRSFTASESAASRQQQANEAAAQRAFLAAQAQRGSIMNLVSALY